MSLTFNHAPEIAGLQLALLNSEARIDDALDRGDRKAFRVYCKRRASLIARIERLLLTAATKES